MSKAHADEAAFHLDNCKTLSETRKAAGMGGDLDELEPLPQGLSRVIPDNPNFHPVPRVGMREIGKADVAPEFRKLVAIETGEDEPE